VRSECVCGANRNEMCLAPFLLRHIVLEPVFLFSHARISLRFKLGKFACGTVHGLHRLAHSSSIPTTFTDLYFHPRVKFWSARAQITPCEYGMWPVAHVWQF
jgi:hypothetical protein